MTRVWRMIAAAACAALAQAAAAQTPGPSPAIGQAWDREMVDAFFTDSHQPRLRDDGEIAQRWAALPADMQEAIRTDCAALEIDMRAPEGGASGGITDAEVVPPNDAPAGIAPDDARMAAIAAGEVPGPVWAALCAAIDGQ